MLFRPSLILQLIDATLIDVEITFPVSTGTVCVVECYEKLDDVKTVIVESVEDIEELDNEIFERFPAMYLKARAVNKLVRRCFPEILTTLMELRDAEYR